MLRGPSSPGQVAPAAPVDSATEAATDLQRQLTRQRTQLRSFRDKPRPRITWRQVLRAGSHWGSFVLVVTLVTSQLTCIFWSSQTTEQYMIYGQNPTEGAYHIDGYNDEPYSDRSLVCVQQGRLYRPMQLSDVLASSKTEVVDTTGESVSGYRVVSRQETRVRVDVLQRYVLACDVLLATLPTIIETCTTLGYKTVRHDDDLLIVDGVVSQVTQRVANSLPVLIIPYWDNSIYARYAIPGRDGSACIAHFSGLFDSSTETGAWMRAVNRSVRESRTAQWLGIPENNRAQWRNGWLDDPTTGQRWYSGIASSVRFADDKYGMRERQFDLLTNREIDCVRDTQLCHPTVVPEWWGNKFFSTDSQEWFNSVAVSNGSRFGLFLYEAEHRSTIHSVYDIATLISNTTVAALLFRWFTAVVVLFNAYRRGYSRGFSAPGIGCLACSRSFELLPLLLLPRMTNALAAFFTAGCKFEGEQRSISEAWFVIYPAIAEVMLYYYSVLNLIAKVSRRRMSDELFGPSLAFLCFLHWLRRPLAISGVFEFDGRIATVMTAAEYEELRLVDFFTTSVALRLNGNVWSIFGIKLAVLAVNVVPLVIGEKLTPTPWVTEDANDQVAKGITAIERAIGVRASESAGLGVSLRYHYGNADLTRGGKVDVPDGGRGQRRLNCYELVRLGYIVFGDVVVMSVTDWLTLVMFSFLRSRTRVSNYRVMAFRVVVAAPQAAIGIDRVAGVSSIELEGRKPSMYQINDPLLFVTVWDVAAVPLP